MFYVRLRTMTKNRIVTVFDRYPEQTALLKKLGDLFGKAGRIQLAQVKVSEIDRIQIDRGLDFIGDIDVRIKQSEATIRAMTKANTNVKLLKTIPGIGEFFARLIDAEIDDISRFRNPKKLAAYAGLVPSTYSSGGKTFLHWRPFMARSSSRATSGCAGPLLKPSPLPSPAIRSFEPSMNT
ncbi:transposase (plasmid) [Rhizobium favelukesii]|uniref:Transposase n=1 Tax=Rhizobium favelukesii TaxID=348824 RepID=W6RK59_9HYPH|nr:transposase [Rhizobium favelukesii]